MSVTIDKLLGKPLLHSHTEKVDKAGDTMTGTLNTPKVEIPSATGVNALEILDATTVKASMKWASNTVTLDIPSPEPDNKIVNAGFETDLSSWTSTLSYILNDQFTTDRAAGAVNGTSAEPTGGTRTVVDTNSKLSITDGQLSISGGNSIYGDPGLWYEAQSRASGKVFVSQITPIGGRTHIGFDTGTSGNLDAYFIRFSQSADTIYLNSTSFDVGASQDNTPYQVAFIVRDNGYYTLIKGGEFTNWTMLWETPSGSTATLYPSITTYDGIVTSDFIRIPTATWLPTPLAYDTFTRADGAIGSSETTGPDSQTTPSLAWTGGAISTNKNVITPTLGSELVANGTMEVDASGWTGIGGLDTLERNTITPISGTGDLHIVDAQNVNSGAYGTGIAVTAGQWVYQTLAARKVGTRTANVGLSSTVTADAANTLMGGTNFFTLTTSNANYFSLNRVTTSGTIYPKLVLNDELSTREIYVDNFSVKILTLSSLFSSVSTSDADVIADANVTLTAGTQAGLVLNLDSTSSPANFIIVYHNGTSVKVDEAVAGVYTNKQTTTVTYSAGATLRAIRGGTKLRVYYNNVFIGAELTMTANTNTKHGLFSTYSGNSFDNFTLWPRGSGTTKFTDAPFEELTVTRDTTTKYAGAASAKLVAGGVDANFLQSVTLPDTATYTLIAYAYTDGSAVTTADLDLYYDTGVLSTTFTSAGSGWYKLTGTLTGVASAKSYGVRVHAGKTVYVDSFSLQAETGVTTTFEILNSGTGNLHHNWEGTGTFNAGIATEPATINKGATSQSGNIDEWQNSVGTVLSKINEDGVIFPVQAATVSAPTYVKGGIYFDTTLNKLMVGGASGWETCTSI